MEDRRVESAVELRLLRNDVDDLKKDIKEMKAEISGLVSAWKTATGMVSFVKWMAGAVTATGILWAVFKAGLKVH